MASWHLYEKTDCIPEMFPRNWTFLSVSKYLGTISDNAKICSVLPFYQHEAFHFIIKYRNINPIIWTSFKSYHLNLFAWTLSFFKYFYVEYSYSLSTAWLKKKKKEIYKSIAHCCWTMKDHNIKAWKISTQN